VPYPYRNFLWLAVAVMLRVPISLRRAVRVMAEMTRPDRLGPTGRALWRRLTSPAPGEELLFSSAERVTLELACRQADDLAALEAQLRIEGLVVIGSKGQSRLSGLPTEIRLQRAALGRLIAALALPEETEEEGLTPAQRKAQRAAQARWLREHQAKARGREARGG
jgi:phage terminase small subunit